MAARPHKPARKVGKTIRDEDFQPHNEGYPDIPSDDPGLVGGPPTEAVPGSRRQGGRKSPADRAGNGGEATLSGRPRETGGHRPPKKIPKTGGS